MTSLEEQVRAALDHAVPGGATASDEGYREVLRRAHRRRGLRTAVLAAAAVIVVAGGTGIAVGTIGGGHQVRPATGGSPSAALEIPLSPRVSTGTAVTTNGILVFGGLSTASTNRTSEQRTPQRDAAYYDAATRRWHTTAASPLSPRSSTAVVAVNEHTFLVAGGEDRGVTPPRRLHDAALYHARSNQWSTLGSAPNCPMLATALAGRVYTWGSCDAQTVTKFAVYDTAADSWTALPTGPLAEVSAIGVADGRVLAFSDDGHRAQFNPANDTWSAQTMLPLFNEHADLLGARIVAVQRDNSLVVVVSAQIGDAIGGGLYVVDSQGVHTVPTEAQSLDWPSDPEAPAAGVGNIAAWTAPSGIYWYDFDTAQFGHQAATAASVISPLLLPLEPSTIGVWSPEAEPSPRQTWNGASIQVTKGSK